MKQLLSLHIKAHILKLKNGKINFAITGDIFLRLLEKILKLKKVSATEIIF
jgi:hypothetical protein